MLPVWLQSAAFQTPPLPYPHEDVRNILCRLRQKEALRVMRRMPLCEQRRLLMTNIAVYVRSPHCAVFNVSFSFNAFSPSESFLSSATDFRKGFAFGGFPGFFRFSFRYKERLIKFIYLKKRMEHLWNDTDRGKPKINLHELYLNTQSVPHSKHSISLL